MFKARMKFAKEGRAKYISHLDLMHAMQRSMARCQMPLWFTEGFNQHAYVSVALPLSTGYSGECEFLDFNITAEAVPENAVEALVYAGGVKPGESLLVTNARHEDLLRRAQKYLADAEAAVKAEEPLDIIEIDVKESYTVLGEIIGESVTDDIINEVFARFCLGK